MFTRRTQTLAKGQNGMELLTEQGRQQFLLGPQRVYPGRLSVSRTFGVIEAKMPKFGGNPDVIIAEPDIKAFRILDSHDFLLLACKVLCFANAPRRRGL